MKVRPWQLVPEELPETGSVPLDLLPHVSSSLSFLKVKLLLYKYIVVVVLCY